jgi:hypothetical protein
MPSSSQKNRNENSFEIRIGKRYISVTPLPSNEVAKANARIQRKVQPVVSALKKTRRAATITASRIILNS